MFLLLEHKYWRSVFLISFIWGNFIAGIETREVVRVLNKTTELKLQGCLTAKTQNNLIRDCFARFVQTPVCVRCGINKSSFEHVKLW